MKLYYSPGACSLSPHIALREAGIPFELVRVDLATHRTAQGLDYRQIHTKGYVPLLELPSGERLGEGPVIAQFVADQAPHRQLAPPPGSFARYRLQEWLNFLTSELHKGFSPLFSAATPESYRPVARQRLAAPFTHVEGALSRAPFLMGETFSVADAYLFAIARWAAPTGVSLAGLPQLERFLARVSERPAVQEALSAELS